MDIQEYVLSMLGMALPLNRKCTYRKWTDGFTCIQKSRARANTVLNIRAEKKEHLIDRWGGGVISADTRLLKTQKYSQ